MKNSPSQSATNVLERLEKISFVAAASVAIGVLGEAFREIMFRKPEESRLELAWAVVSNTVVFLAVVVEAYCVFAAIRWTREEKRESDAQVAEAQKLAAEANARAEEANKIAEQTRLERLQLEAKLAPRSLSDDEAKRIRDALSPFADVRADLVSYGSGFPEVARTCGVLMHVLHVSGWRMNALPPPEPSWSLEGIHIGLQQPHDEETRLAKSALINVLNEVGWDSQEWLLPLPAVFVPGMIVDARYSAPMRIMVGFKPDPLNPAIINATDNEGI